MFSISEKCQKGDQNILNIASLVLIFIIFHVHVLVFIGVDVGELRGVPTGGSCRALMTGHHPPFLDLIAAVVSHVLLDKFSSCPVLGKTSFRHVRMRLAGLKHFREQKKTNKVLVLTHLNIALRSSGSTLRKSSERSMERLMILFRTLRWKRKVTFTIS
jgi:hypothetical protein